MKSTVLACNSFWLFFFLLVVTGFSVTVGVTGVIISIEIIDGSIVAVMFGVCVCVAIVALCSL